MQEREEKREVENRRRERQKKKEDKQKQSKIRRDKEGRIEVKVEKETCNYMYLYESEEDSAACPICGLMYVDDDGVWICCDRCDQWFDIHCTDISSETSPEKYFVSYVRRS